MEKPDANGCWHAEKNIYSEIAKNCNFSNLKRIAAILLLALMVFSLVGYRWLFSVIENKATAQLEQKISAGQYTDDQLVEIRIPLDMPYYSDQDYEEVYGETDFNGEHYRYVKRKVSGNTLYLLCIPNKQKTEIVKAKNEFAKALNDIPSNEQSQQKTSLIKLLTTEFKVPETSVTENNVSSSSLRFINQNAAVADQFTPFTDAQPPEA